MSKQMALSPSAYSFKAIRQSLNPSDDGASASSSSGGSASLAKVVIDQADLFAFLFSPMLEQVDKRADNDEKDDETEDEDLSA